MRVLVKIKPLFGADSVTSTKGQHWRIRQFAGFLLSAERCHSYTAVIHNPTSHQAEVTITSGVQQATLAVTTTLAAGEIKAILVPVAKDSNTLSLRTQHQLALLELVGHQVSSAWVQVAGKVQVTGFSLEQANDTGIARLAADQTGQLRCFDADTHAMQLSCNAAIELYSKDWKLQLNGYATLLLDSATPKELYLRALAPTNLSLKVTHYADRSSEWVAPSGMPVWNI